MAKTNTNTTGIIQRNDYEAFTNNIRETIFFRASRDPEGKGGCGGIAGGIKCPTKEEIEEVKKQKCFCPTCGKKINWKNIKGTDNSLR